MANGLLVVSRNLSLASSCVVGVLCSLKETGNVVCYEIFVERCDHSCVRVHTLFRNRNPVRGR